MTAVMRTQRPLSRSGAGTPAITFGLVRTTCPAAECSSGSLQEAMFFSCHCFLHEKPLTTSTDRQAARS
jgi:hypothetical protein